MQEHFDETAHEPHRGEVSGARNPPESDKRRWDPSRARARVFCRALLPFGMTRESEALFTLAPLATVPQKCCAFLREPCVKGGQRGDCKGIVKMQPFCPLFMHRSLSLCHPAPALHPSERCAPALRPFLRHPTPALHPFLRHPEPHGRAFFKARPAPLPALPRALTSLRPGE